MEQDVDDTEDVEQKAERNKSQTKGSKRRRDLVSDLQIWGWHSKRRYTKKAKVDKDLTIEDAMTRIIPKYLLPHGINEAKSKSFEDSMDTMELYNMHVGKNSNSLMSLPCSPQDYDSNKAYFGNEKEKLDVQKFWNQEWTRCDAVNLIAAYVTALAELWKYKWPEALINIYLEAYGMHR